MNQQLDSFERVLIYGHEYFGLKIRFKNQSNLMKLLGFLLFFNKKFMTDYITVIGKNVYFPSAEWLDSHREKAAHILCHELVHVIDESRVGSVVFKMSYLFPQWLAIFSLFSFVVGPWAMMFLLFLTPIPAPFRAFWEMRGYTMSDAVSYRVHRQFSNIDWVADQFTSSAYYFMWPFRESLIKEIEHNRILIKIDALEEKIPEACKILDILEGTPRV